MFSTVLLRALNLPELWRHARRRPASVWDPADDLELKLYSAVAGVDYLHYGYFDPIPAEPESVSLGDVRRAMARYADVAVARTAPGDHVLDVGCGTGGLMHRLAEAGRLPAGLTPNLAHARHIRARYPQLPLSVSRLEDVDDAALAGSFDVVLNAESLQYIDLDLACRKVGTLLRPAGKWVVLDYFRLYDSTRNRSGHLLERFEAMLRKAGYAVSERLDITEHVLPTLSFAHTLAARIALPGAQFAAARFFAKHPLLGYLFGDQVANALHQVKLDGVDPAVFRRDKRYMLFEMTKPG